MKRTLGALLALAGYALVGLPLAGAQALVEVDADVHMIDDVRGDLPLELGDQLPSLRVNVDAAPLVGLTADGRSDTGMDVDAEGPAPEAAGELQMEAGSLLDEQPEASLAAAGAVTGLALLSGLAAYHWGSLKVLLGGFGVGLFSRIDRNQMLDNEMRHKIYEAISNNPGVTIKEITMLLGCGWGTAVYHLKRLESERLIASERNRQFRRFFKNGSGISNDSKGAFSELKNPTSQKIAEKLLAQPGTCQKDLCQALGISPPLASKYLGRLRDAGLVSAQRDWKVVKYFPTDRLQGLLLVSKGLELTGAPRALDPVPLAA